MKGPSMWFLYCFFAIVIGVSSLIIMSSLSGVFQDKSYFTAENTPDGWYRQRQCINMSYMRTNDGGIWFAICDHSYLGPLHGFYPLASNVDLTVVGWYDLRVKNNTIVEARIYLYWLGT